MKCFFANILFAKMERLAKGNKATTISLWSKLYRDIMKEISTSNSVNFVHFMYKHVIVKHVITKH